MKLRMFKQSTILIALSLAGLFFTSMTRATLFDPTRPANRSHEISNGALSLESTIVSEERRLATINGRVMKVGDRFQGATLIAIYPYRVELKRGSRIIYLRLHPRLNKTDAVIEKE